MLLRRLGQVAHPTEQVDFPGRDADLRLIDVGVEALALAELDQRLFRIGRRAGGPDGRQQIGPLHLILRPCLLNIGHRNAQVAIVGEARLDHPHQTRVGEEIAPGGIGRHDRRAAVRRGRIGRPLGAGLRHRQFGAGIFGRHVTGGQRQRQRGDRHCFDITQHSYASCGAFGVSPSALRCSSPS